MIELQSRVADGLKAATAAALDSGSVWHIPVYHGVSILSEFASSVKVMRFSSEQHRHLPLYSPTVRPKSVARARIECRGLLAAAPRDMSGQTGQMAGCGERLGLRGTTVTTLFVLILRVPML